MTKDGKESNFSSLATSFDYIAFVFYLAIAPFAGLFLDAR